MVVGVEPQPSPHGPEAPALALTASGVLVLNGTVGLQVLWLVLIGAVVLARKNAHLFTDRSGPGAGESGEGPGGGLRGPRDPGPTPEGGTR